MSMSSTIVTETDAGIVIAPSGHHHHHVDHGHDDEKTRCRSVKIDIGLLCIAVVMVIIQFGLFDYYFVKYGHVNSKDYLKDGEVKHLNCSRVRKILHENEEYTSYEYVYYFIAPDLIAVAAMAALPIIQAVKRYGKGAEGKECRDALSNIRFAYASWLVYAIVFDIKIVVSSKTFMRLLLYMQVCDKEEERSMLMGVNVFVLILCGAAVVFLFLILSHHAHSKRAKEILQQITEITTFDVLDGVHFLQITLLPEEMKFLHSNPNLEGAIVALVCINFLLPTVSLLKVFHRLSPAKDIVAMRRNKLRYLFEEDIAVVLFLFLINFPYLVIRCYLWYGMELEMSVFILKNAIMMVLQARQMFVCSRRIWRFLLEVPVAIEKSGIIIEKL